MPSRHDDIVGLILALVIVLGTVALAHVLPAATSASPPQPASFDNKTSCAEWTDGCVVCQRTGEGLACSTPGIACVPRERQCLRREGV
jgi:hypothetical protein